MCGIAGYTLEPGAGLARTLAAQALLAGIAERGADAVGYAHRSSEGAAIVHKRRAGASALLRSWRSPRRHAKSSSTCATTRRAIRRSRPTTTPCGTAMWSGSTTASSSTTRRSSPSTASNAKRPRCPSTPRRSSPWPRSSDPAARRSSSSVARWRPRGWTSASRGRLSRPRRRSSPLGREGCRGRLLRLHEARAGGLRVLPPPAARKARARRGHVAQARGGPRVAPRAFQPGSGLHRDAAARRTGTGRARQLPTPLGGACVDWLRLSRRGRRHGRPRRAARGSSTETSTRPHA